MSRISRSTDRRLRASPANRRRSRNSSAQRSSGGCSARMRRKSAPVPRRAGAIVATTRPRRTTVNVSPRCSTASKRSAKRFEASVALISLTIRLSDSRRGCQATSSLPERSLELRQYRLSTLPYLPDASERPADQGRTRRQADSNVAAETGCSSGSVGSIGWSGKKPCSSSMCSQSYADSSPTVEAIMRTYHHSPRSSRTASNHQAPRDSSSFECSYRQQRRSPRLSASARNPGPR